MFWPSCMTIGMFIAFISDHGSVEHHARRHLLFYIVFSLFSHRENIPRTVFVHYALTHCAGMAFSRYFHSVADTGFISIAPAACDHSANNHLVNTVYQHVEFGNNPEYYIIAAKLSVEVVKFAIQDEHASACVLGILEQRLVLGHDRRVKRHQLLHACESQLILVRFRWDCILENFEDDRHQVTASGRLALEFCWFALTLEHC